jgi:hypothetical protein
MLVAAIGIVFPMTAQLDEHCSKARFEQNFSR